MTDSIVDFSAIFVGFFFFVVCLLASAFSDGVELRVSCSWAGLSVSSDSSEFSASEGDDADETDEVASCLPLLLLEHNEFDEADVESIDGAG